ncbi:MAG: GntR family transcriptional regulator [Thiomonas sp.]|uniref:Putative Bacterial regulatory proteins,gntR family n=1 Tax=mine drainage metagenome TaxID=410659 RepID=E6PVR7_9ZZZZ
MNAKALTPNRARQASEPKPSNAAPAAPEQDSTQTIAAAITSAIIEHRLAPGAKLTEQKIAAIYGVSRTIVRQALFQLARDHLVTLEPARGAFVSQPSVEEAQQVFAVRRMLEQHLVEEFCDKATPADFRAMRAHLKQEQAVVGRVDVTGRTRLLGDFHVLMAERIGNIVLAQILSELISRCALITLMYQSSRAAQHSSDEHVAILRALESRDVKQAKTLMEAHLRETENSLLYHPRTSSADLTLALAAYAA